MVRKFFVAMFFFCQTDPKNEQAKVNLNYFEAEQLDLGEANKDKAATRSRKMAKDVTKKKEGLMSTYKRLCRGDSRKVSIEN